MLLMPSGWLFGQSAITNFMKLSNNKLRQQITYPSSTTTCCVVLPQFCQVSLHEAMDQHLDMVSVGWMMK